MASADFCRFNRYIAARVTTVGISSLLPVAFQQISAGKLVNLPPIYLLHLHHEPRIASDFVLFGKLIQLKIALYAVSVRQAGILPPASFRFHLAVDTLAFS